LFVCATLFLFSIPDQAQQSLQVLNSHVRPAVSSGQAALVSVLPPEQHLNVSIVLPLRNQSELTSLLNRLYDPSSPDYRHFLSVDQFTEKFGPTVQDYQTVVEFAQANGFAVTGMPANRLLVPISGSVAQIEKAFHVSMNVYRHPTEDRTFYSPDREPSLDLGVPVAQIAGLNDYSIPRPLLMKPSAGQAATGSGPGGLYLAGDMRAAYYGRSALTGSGQTVGLLEFGGYDINDVTLTFDGTATSNADGANYVLAYTPTVGGVTYNIPINNVLLDGATGAPFNGEDAEQVVDIAQAIGMAPGLSQVRVYIGHLDADLFNAMASENIAQQLSVSWTWVPEKLSSDDAFFQEFAAQGQSLFVGSGDWGAFGSGVNFYFPAEDAWVTAVGGTNLVTNGAGGSWGSETAWVQSGGGISPDNIAIPNWQAGVGNSSNGGSATLRNVPDVAAEASDSYGCNVGACQGFSGTSFASPRWAGFMALVNQQAVASGNPTLGFLNPAIYGLGEGSKYDSEFHDITIGNNNYYNQPTWYSAVAGYDLVTGWGSPAGQSLIDALAPPASGFKLSASPSSLTINPGATATTTIKVTPQPGFTGSVDLSVTGLPSGVTPSFAPNPATGTSVLTLTANSAVLHASYSVTVTGTSAGLTATAKLVLNVGVSTTTNLSISPSGGSLTEGASYTLTATVSPASGSTMPTGNVVFTIGSATKTIVLNSSGVATYTGAASTAAGSLTLSAAYQGVPGFSASKSNVLNETVVTPAAVSLSSTSIAFGNQAVKTESTYRPVTLTNTGGSPLTIGSIALTGTNRAQFLVSSNYCPASLAAGANCAIHLHFYPQLAGAAVAALTISDNAAGSPQSVTLTGTGTAPAVSLSPTTIAFGNQAVKTESTYLGVTLTNTGTASLTIAGIALSGSNETQFLISSNTCPATLAVGANCVIHMHFYPQATGAAVAALTITDSAAGSPQSVTLTGTGTAPAVTLAPTSIAFGFVPVNTESAIQPVTLTNIGTASLTITSIALTGTNEAQFLISSNTCPASLAAGANCVIHLRFYPQVIGAASATLSITDNATGSPQSVALTGTGSIPPAVSLSPTSIDFGTQIVGTESLYQPVTLTNTGGGPLTINSIALTGTNPAQFVSLVNCPGNLAAGTSCTISVRFYPQVVGSAAAKLTITDNASSSPQSITLTGFGR
jgi:hypothetical protein